jgi:hypothetical protein
VRWVALLVATLMGCNSSSGSPNTTPGQCVLSNGIWYCGGAYGNYPACNGTESCANDASPCFSCDLNGVAGAVYSCQHDQDGGRTWEAIPSGTGCKNP